MGIYDREYYRNEPRGLVLTGNRSVVVNLVLINVAVFILDWFTMSRTTSLGGGDSVLMDYIALDTNVFQTWRVWQLLTYGFAHANMMHILLNMFVLWMFGREVEGIYGKKQFLSLYLSLIVLSGAGWVLLEILLMQGAAAPVVSSLVGASGAVSGVFLIFILHFPKRTLLIWGILPAPAWLIGLLCLAGNLVGLRSGGNIAYSAHLIGALFGLVFYRWRWTLASLLPGRWFAGNPLRRRPRLRLHDPAQDDAELESRVDQILRKIHDQGAESLTKEEKRLLEQASRRAQHRKRQDVN